MKARPRQRLPGHARFPLVALLAAQGSEAPARVDLAGGEHPAELVFEVRERDGARVPARLTFVPAEGAGGALFPLFKNARAAPRDFAARDDVVYARTGAGRITVPPGRYTLYASRGPEWSLACTEVELVAGETRAVELELVHELATPGWMSADFHLHTLTFSGHGDANVEERLLSCLGEGLEFAVATDHDHLTDYRPALEALGLQGALATVTGDEVTTPIGHFNVFPLAPAGTPVDSSLTDANELFRRLRAVPGPGGVAPLIQVNHPRLAGLDYFGHAGLDPVTGTSADPRYAHDFDALEVLNENRAQGYLDALDGGPAGQRHSVLADWFHLLDQGERPAVVGNSDSHHVHALVPGYPRNYVRVAHDEPARADPAEVVAAVRAKQLFTTTGPFVEVAVEGAPMGGQATAKDGHARLALHVRAASWVDCDRAKVFVNGELAATVPIAASRAALRLDQELELCFRRTCERHGRAREGAPFDGWVVVVVEGDDALVPVLGPECRPLALTNPVWVDGDGDGKWTSPRERLAAELHAEPTPDLTRTWFARLAPEEQALAVSLAPRGPVAAVLVEDGLASRERTVRRAAARAAERHVLPGSLPTVLRAWNENQDDPYLGALLLRVVAAARPAQAPANLLGYVKRFGQEALRRYADEILPLFPGNSPAAWQVLGPLPAEPGASAPPPAAVGDDGKSPAWSPLPPGSTSEYVDLQRRSGAASEHARFYVQTFVRAAAARVLPCAFGSDDGARVWWNGRLVYENPAAKSADPLETLLTLECEPGWNRLVLEIENATGACGFYCRPLDPEIELASEAR